MISTVIDQSLGLEFPIFREAWLGWLMHRLPQVFQTQAVSALLQL